MEHAPLREWEAGGRNLWLWAEGKRIDAPGLPLVVMPAGEDAPDQLAEILPLLAGEIASGNCRPFRLAVFPSENWNRDYTPWPGTALFKKEPPFSGGGPETLDWIQKHLLPALAEKTQTDYCTQNTAILGYSLAGLFALWAFYESGLFGSVASCSGSLWYEGWAEYAAGQNAPAQSRAYLSLGEKEEQARNPRMASVGDATRQMAEQLQADPNIAETVLAWSPGGHFSEVPQRIARGLVWLMKP